MFVMLFFQHRQSFQEWEREHKQNIWPRPPTGWDSKLKQQKEEIIGGHSEVPKPPLVTLRAHNAQGYDLQKRSALYTWCQIILRILCMEGSALCWYCGHSRTESLMATAASCQQIQHMIFASSSVSYIRWLGLYFTLLFFFHLKQYLCREEEAWEECLNSPH